MRPKRSYEADEAVHEVALNRKSEFSGVDLDTEAARLLEQQQAYQALAKVLSTAKELGRYALEIVFRKVEISW